VSPRFSLVYPTRHRPEFVRQALGILERQDHDSFEVIICDNFVDPALSCEVISRESSVANVRYVRPPKPFGMVENWNYALQYATGDYVCYFTDKMFVLPNALRRVERAIGSANGPEIVSWTSDAYNPDSNADYFGPGRYVKTASKAGSSKYRRYSPGDALDGRGRADVARGEQLPADYVRGKLVFGAYRRELVQRIVDRYGSLFHNISPDYTSMILGLAEARDAIEMAASCVVSVNTDISNGMLADTDDTAALGFLNSLAGGAEHILPNLFVPGLYASVHNSVAHDYMTLKKAFNLSFEFNVANWLVYCYEDVYRPARHWSDPRVEAEQKRLLQVFLASLDPGVQATVKARLAERSEQPATPNPGHPLRRVRTRWVPRPALRALRALRRPQRTEPIGSTSILAAISSISERSWV
jgi:glycosyltransferase involved in cell wall biosynthesis